MMRQLASWVVLAVMLAAAACSASREDAPQDPPEFAAFVATKVKEGDWHAVRDLMIEDAHGYEPAEVAVAVSRTPGLDVLSAGAASEFTVPQRWGVVEHEDFAVAYASNWVHLVLVPYGDSWQVHPGVVNREVRTMLVLGNQGSDPADRLDLERLHAVLVGDALWSPWILWRSSTPLASVDKERVLVFVELLELPDKDIVLRGRFASPEMLPETVEIETRQLNTQRTRLSIILPQSTVAFPRAPDGIDFIGNTGDPVHTFGFVTNEHTHDGDLGIFLDLAYPDPEYELTLDQAEGTFQVTVTDGGN